MKTHRKAARSRENRTLKSLSAPALAVPVMLGSSASELYQTWQESYGSTWLRLQPVIKRVFDIAASSVALIVLSLAFLIIGGAIALTSPGPIFYRASRVGRYGRVFKMYKFRTMVVNADKMGPGITTRNDQRVTGIGRLLRKTKLDELPQLINVLRGEMSIVGPRPEDPRYVKHYTPEEATVLKVRPGITSPASVHYHDEENLIGGEDWETRYLREIMPSKLRLDIEYARHPSVGRDIGLIFQTLQAIGREIRH
jgi:lipopolysaccharide/colanic/teichoic acid biosynthesis glycosyltransferase